MDKRLSINDNYEGIIRLLEVLLSSRRGSEEKKLEAIRNLMDSLKLTMEQAMNALKVPEEDRQKYMELLNK